MITTTVRVLPDTPTGGRSITNLMAGSGEDWALNSLRSGVADNSPGNVYSKFGNQLMNLLMRYQSFGTKPYEEGRLALGQRAVERTMAEATPGMSPSLQGQIRSADVGALSPSIEGLANRQKTFVEQLQGFGDALNQAKGIGSWLEESEMKRQSEARDLIFKLPSAVKKLSDKEKRLLEQQAGLQKGLIDLMPDSLEESWSEPYKLDNGDIVQKNNKTGEIRKISSGASSAVTKDIQQKINDSNYVISQMDELVNLWDKIPNQYKGYFQGKISNIMSAKSFSKEVQNFESARSLVGMALTRLFEKGVISDKDREFYLSQMPNVKQNSREIVEVSANQVKSQLRAKVESLQGEASGAGINLGGSNNNLNEIEVIAPDGTEGTIPASELEEAIKQGYRKK